MSLEIMLELYAHNFIEFPGERETAPPKNGHPPFCWQLQTKRGGAVLRSPGELNVYFSTRRVDI